MSQPERLRLERVDLWQEVADQHLPTWLREELDSRHLLHNLAMALGGNSVHVESTEAEAVEYVPASRLEQADSLADAVEAWLLGQNYIPDVKAALASYRAAGEQ